MMESEDEARRAVEAVYQKAKAGDAEAQLKLARHLTYEDPAGSLSFYRRAAESGLLQAQYELAVRLMTDRRELKEAVQRHEDSSELLSEYQGLQLIAVGPEFDEAFQWLQKAARAGHREAQYTLGSLYDQGKGVQKDAASAREWYAKAAESGHPHAQYEMGLLCALGGETEDVSWFRAAAEQGHLEAVFLLASWLQENGKPSEAAEWYRKALDGGHHKSEFSLGYLLATQLDQAEEGARLIRAAAERGEVDAQRNLAAMYGMGHGVPKDEKESARWYRLAAEQGHPEGQFRVGLMYYLGNVVPADRQKSIEWLCLALKQGHESATELVFDILGEMEPDEAFGWYQRLADSGVAEGHDRLGIHYSQRGDKRAVDHFRAAAEAGHLSGQYNLGVMYYQGTLIEQDDEQAVSWFRKAADAGFPRACHNMGALLEESDFDEALRYYEKAARLGVPEAQARLTELRPQDSQNAGIVSVCNLIINQAIDDQADAFRIQWGLVQFRVDGTWHDVMNPPEHVMQPFFERFREIAGMGPEERAKTIHITTADEADYLLDLQFEESDLMVTIRHR